MNTPLKILLTGASGTVGSEVLKQLTANGTHQITVFDLKSKHNEQFYLKYSSSISVIYGKLNDIESINNLPKGFDIVIHLAAIIPPFAEEKPELAKQVNVYGTQLLLNQLEKFSPNSFFIYSSSISVYGDRVKTPAISVTDQIKISEGDTYGQTKSDAEDIIKSGKLNWTIFRLAAIMKNHKISKLMFHMPLDTQLEICSPEDTARAFVFAIENRKLLEKKTFNLGGGISCVIKYENFLRISFQLFGLGKINFPQYSFAQKNFHCGYYVDGDLLENLLHFRRDTLVTYFSATKNSISPVVKFTGKLFRFFIKKHLIRKSEPLNAVKKFDKQLILHFFGSKELELISKQTNQFN